MQKPAKSLPGPIGKPWVRAAACATLWLGWTAPVTAEESPSFQQQDFLFLLEEAYTQEAGEWQASASLDRQFNPGSSLVELDLEYGITERLQLSVQLPWSHEPGASGLSASELAIDYAVLKDEGFATPELTIGAAVIAPTGDDDVSLNGWGYEVSLRTSKLVLPATYVHGMVAYERVTSEGESAAEWSLGGGLAFRPSRCLTLIGEYIHEIERETDGLGATERQSEDFLSGGIVFEIADDLLIGAGGALNLQDSDEHRLLASVQIEW